MGNGMLQEGILLDLLYCQGGASQPEVEQWETGIPHWHGLKEVIIEPAPEASFHHSNKPDGRNLSAAYPSYKGTKLSFLSGIL